LGHPVACCPLRADPDKSLRRCRFVPVVPGTRNAFRRYFVRHARIARPLSLRSSMRTFFVNPRSHTDRTAGYGDEVDARALAWRRRRSARPKVSMDGIHVVRILKRTQAAFRGGTSPDRQYASGSPESR
jgi:hypothetical protein